MAERKAPGWAGRITFEDAAGDRPDLEIHAIGADDKVLATAKVDDEGQFALPTAAGDKAARIAITSAGADPTDAATKTLSYRIADARALLDAGEIPISKAVIDHLLWRFACVSGSVRRCYPWRPFIDELIASTAASVIRPLALSRSASASRLIDTSLIDARLFIPPYRCSPVCQGTIEVYRRTCCCQPPIFIDPDEIVQGPIDWPPPPPGDPPWQPEIDPSIPPIPPGPGPDPAPLERLEMITTSGALDARKLNAQRDELALRVLRDDALSKYVSIRPYLWCSCGSGTKVAEGVIADDGTFSICWREYPQFVLPDCGDEYGYRVTQVINGVSVTIYDGPAAGQWFSPGTHPTLTAYSRAAISCREQPPVPGAGPHTVILHRIGSTESWQLGTPAQDSPDTVMTLAGNSGLLFPAAPDGPSVNVPLGGVLGLYYDFLDMKGIARSYRVDMAPANAAGDPIGAWTPVAVPQWTYWNRVGSTWMRAAQTLGPDANGQFIIPYDETAPLDPGEQWDDFQYHAVIDTTAFPNGRYLVRLKVFNAGGALIKPNGATGPGTGAGFTYGRWRIAAGPPDDVPYSALTHVLWWNNQHAVAHVDSVGFSGVPGSPVCQFLEGSPGTGVEVRYRSYHAYAPAATEPSFLQSWAMTVVKGIGGGNPVSAGFNDYREPGKPPGGPEVTSTSLGALLGSDQKCAFSVVVNAHVKTNNGSGRLINYDAWDVGAFAAEQH
jgi:hypothetical protein